MRREERTEEKEEHVYLSPSFVTMCLRMFTISCRGTKSFPMISNGWSSERTEEGNRHKRRSSSLSYLYVSMCLIYLPLSSLSYEEERHLETQLPSGTSPRPLQSPPTYINIQNDQKSNNSSFLVYRSESLWLVRLCASYCSTSKTMK